MAKLKESVNSSIFFALKNSETSGVPCLLCGNPGCGKSTTVELFAKIRGYDIVVLRGSTMSETEVMGFDAVNQKKDSVETQHCRPTWYTRLLESSAKGKKTLLFIDELTCCSQYIQSSLLNLIFERRVDAEKLPDDCLIVAAGNSINNMTGEFQTLSALWNRFCIFNITMDENALDEFLSVYSGASTGVLEDLLTIKKKELDLMDKQKVDLPENLKPRVCEYLETAVRETARFLMKSETVLDLNCSETQGIYNSQRGEDIMRGFISMRSLSYLTRMAVSAYLNFGSAGIKSDNFRKVIEGLCGLALSRSRDSKRETVISKVGENFYQSLVQTLPNIDKLSNSKVLVHETFFNKIFEDGKSELSQEDIAAVNNKLEEMLNDPEIKNISQPLDESIVKTLCTLLEKKAKKEFKIKLNSTQPINEVLTPEFCTGLIMSWNSTISVINKLNKLIPVDKRDSMSSSLSNILKNSTESFQQFFMKLGSYAKMTVTNFPEYKSLIPQINPVL